MLVIAYATLREICDLLSSKIYIFLWVLPNCAPSSTQFHPSPPSSFQSPPSFLLHPPQYSNKNITCNWAISPNLGRKIQICPFWLKIRTHGILEVLISNPDLDFWNSDPKIHFWANLEPKSWSCLFCLEIGTHGISYSNISFLNFKP